MPAESSLKDTLIEKLLDCPLEFGKEDLKTLTSLKEPDNLTFEDLRKIMTRIFDINENILLVDSDAGLGLMGRFNKKSSAKRLKEFNRRIKTRGHGKHINILAEGDSWFQFPVFVTDIIDWMTAKNPDYAVYSIAYGGDWITNIIYDGKYVAELPILDPKYFLISGGGNDLVGSNRLAIMVNKDDTCLTYPDSRIPTAHPQASKHVTKEFFSFLLVVKLQYYIIFSSIYKKYKDLTIITQGYDHAIPSYNKTSYFKNPVHALCNSITDTGKWLRRPLDIKFIPREMHQPLVRLFIDEINETFIDLAKDFPNVYHMDCRGAAEKPDDWYDELHLKSKVFEKIADCYSAFINGSFKENTLTQIKKEKIIRVKDLWREASAVV